MVKQIVRLGGILCIITLVVTLLLSVVNRVTRDIIAENTLKAENEARADLIDAQDFEMIEEGIYRAISAGETVGYAVSSGAQGYGGEISMIVGVDTRGSVMGVKIINHSETPGLGSRVTQQDFLAGFHDKWPPLAVTKGTKADDAESSATPKGSAGSEVNAISGATISSNAVVKGVNSAVDRLENLGLIKKEEK